MKVRKVKKDYERLGSMGLSEIVMKTEDSKQVKKFVEDEFKNKSIVKIEKKKKRQVSKREQTAKDKEIQEMLMKP
jgi:hypothetical protein